MELIFEEGEFSSGSYQARSQGITSTPKDQNDYKLNFVRFSVLSQGNISKVSLLQDNKYIKWCKEANFVLLCQYIASVWLDL